MFSQQPSTRLLNFLLCIQHYIFNVTVNNFTFFLFQNTNDINKFDILTVIFLVQHLWFLFHSLFSLSFPLSFSLTRKKLHIFEYMYILSFLLFFSRSRTKWNNGKTTKFYSMNQKLETKTKVRCVLIQMKLYEKKQCWGIWIWILIYQYQYICVLKENIFSYITISV